MRENWQSSLLKKQYDPFLEHYLKLYQENPRSRVFAPLAEAYRKSGLIDEAIEICKEGLSYYPNFISGIVALARSLFDKGLYNKAILELEKVVSEVPDNYLVQKLLAESYLKIDDKNNSLKAYKMVLFLNPSDMEIAKKVEELENVNQKTNESNMIIEEQNISHLIPPFPSYENTKIDTSEQYVSENSLPTFNLPETSSDSIELNFEERRASDVFTRGMNDDDEEDAKIITEFSTLTMGELLEHQGMKEQALEVYSKLAEKNPNNIDLKNRIEKLTKELKPAPVIKKAEPQKLIEIKEEPVTTKIEAKIIEKVTDQQEDPDDEWLYPTVTQRRTKNNTSKIEKLKKLLQQFEDYKN